MRFIPIIVFASACFYGALPIASGAPAKFWISASKHDPGVPEAPTINAAIGRPITLYIWAQPATDSFGAFRKLEAVSLDVVSLDSSLQPESAPFIDFIDGTFKVENPTVVGIEKRFQFTTDSYRSEEQGGPLISDWTAEDITNFSLPDGIHGLLGVSLFPTPSVVGIGNNSDPYRVGAGNGAAWRVAEFSFQALQSSGTNDLYLQLGWFGMKHENDGTGNPLLATQVVFGDDTAPIYTAGPSLSHRQTTLNGDTFDIRINAVQFAPGDYDSNGDIGQEDFFAWHSSFGQLVETPGDGADGNGDGVIDAADYVLWRKLFDSGAGAIATFYEPSAAAQQLTIPEPTTAALASTLLFLMLLDMGRRSSVIRPR